MSKMESTLPIGIRDEILKLDIKQLQDLNRLVVDRIKMCRKKADLKSMFRFNIGDAVTFDQNGKKMMGTVTRFNQSTVSVFTSSGETWNISPMFLKKSRLKSSLEKELNELLENGKHLK